MRIAILGAAGRTGQAAVAIALSRGHDVVALARNLAGLPSHVRLEVLRGDATDGSLVQTAVSGADAVLSPLGQTGSGRMICSTAIGHVLACGIERIVTVSGAGLDVATDQKRTLDKIGFIDVDSTND